MKAQLLGIALITTLLTCSAADNFHLWHAPMHIEPIHISVPESATAMLSILVMAGFTFRRIRK